MKRWILLALAIVLTLTLCACRGNAETTTEKPVQLPTTTAPKSPATTAAPTTEAPTTQAPTTAAPTTVPPTTAAPTTQAPTTVPPTTAAPTTQAPTTQAPTTVPPTTAAPTTVHTHSWADATCDKAKTCTVCGATEGEALGHSWADATCDKAKTCTVCGATEGEALGHSWADATCDKAKTCTVCGATEGEALGHSWADATCDKAKTCTVCGATEGDPLPHNYQNGHCEPCGSWEFGYGKWEYFWVEGDTLYAVTLHGSSDGTLTGISNSHYQSIDTVDPATKDSYLQAGAELVTYEGISYLPMGGYGDPCYLKGEGDHVTVQLGEVGMTPEWPERFTLERTAGDQFTVTEIATSPLYGITEGAVFTHKSES